MLHKLVHTKLLSGSLNADLNLTGAQRRKALEGRVLELAGSAKLGKGEHIVRSGEHRRAAKRVREGLADKKQERQKKELEEVRGESYCFHKTGSTPAVGQEPRELSSSAEKALRGLFWRSSAETRARDEDGSGQVQERTTAPHQRGYSKGHWTPSSRWEVTTRRSWRQEIVSSEHFTNGWPWRGCYFVELACLLRSSGCRCLAGLCVYLLWRILYTGKRTTYIGIVLPVLSIRNVLTVDAFEELLPTDRGPCIAYL